MRVVRAGTGVLATLAAACLLCAPAGAAAQAMTLLDAYHLALAQDPRYRSAVEEAAAGEQYRVIGRSFLLPQIQFTYNWARNRSDITRYAGARLGDQTTTEFYRSYSGAVQLRQPLFNWDYWSRFRQGEAQSQASAALFDSRRQELALRVTTAFTEVLEAYDVIALAEAERDALQEQLKQNYRFFDKGEGTRTDIVETQARLDLAVAQVIEARDGLTAARKRLDAILGASQGGQDRLLATLSAGFRAQGPAPADIGYWTDAAIANNPELQSREHGVEAARQDIGRARAGHLPRVDLVASYGENKSETVNTLNTKYDTAYVGLQVAVPLFSGGAVSAQVSQAEANYRKAMAEFDGRRTEVTDEVRKQFDLALSSVVKVGAYEQAEQAARELLHATRLSIAAGMRVNLDLLNAQQQLHTARRNLARARYTNVVTRLRLLFAAGLVTEQDVRDASAQFSGQAAPGQPERSGQPERPERPARTAASRAPHVSAATKPFGEPRHGQH